MRIRRFREEDARRASYLIKKTVRESLKKVYSADVIEALCKANTPAKIIKRAREREYFLAIEGKRVVGINGIKGNEVKTFFVNPRWQGKGIGRRMLVNLERIARRKGCRDLEVNSSLKAQHFYARMGFEKKGKKLNVAEGVEFTDIVMRKKLQ